MFSIPVEKTFPLAATTDAQAASAVGHVAGKLVVTVPWAVIAAPANAAW